MEIIKILEIIIAILLIAVVLIQNKNVALNLSTMGGGMGEVSKRGPEKILHNATIVLGTAFIINSVALFLIS
ncbi:preprotein translocase subunit SecG [Candidatus Gracilibacteria bacterium]|nr:preprotein translocase subunit SecG [Candidatus Gracilibacteria bacterium]